MYGRQEQKNTPNPCVDTVLPNALSGCLGQPPQQAHAANSVALHWRIAARTRLLGMDKFATPSRCNLFGSRLFYLRRKKEKE
ncbi:hypothetical protein [Parasediminibacterium sp. JCM 36343]|uniref:hypothetical protein n=1 Tax=Parasediminibacterium sp. JCM 36343 TaxID=3374279 RepID=UPI00397A9694